MNIQFGSTANAASWLMHYAILNNLKCIMYTEVIHQAGSIKTKIRLYDVLDNISKIQMGNKSIYSKEELLYYHINRKEYGKIEEILAKHPEVIDKPITKDTKHTLLMRAAFKADKEAVDLLLSRKANPSIVTPKGQTALTIAIQKNQLEIVKKLIASGADVNVMNPKNGLKPVDLAILPGFIDIARTVFDKMNPKEIKQSFEYEQIGKKFQYRFVNYKKFLKMLTGQQGVEHEAENNFLQKQKVELYDPVPDPRQSWGEWLKRNVDFKDAPMVERSSLPNELQPQNRKMGKLDILVHNWVKTDAKKKSMYKPKQGRQIQSEMNDLMDRNQKKEGAPDYQSAI